MRQLTNSREVLQGSSVLIQPGHVWTFVSAEDVFVERWLVGQKAVFMLTPSQVLSCRLPSTGNYFLPQTVTRNCYPRGSHKHRPLGLLNADSGLHPAQLWF